jgi:hypothetical protein
MRDEDLPMSPLVDRWLDWLEEKCTVAGHGDHLRSQCRESKQRALRGCVVLETPMEERET